MIKVLIADDHAIVREGLKQILAETSEMTVVGEATNGQQVLDFMNKEEFDFLLLDIAMPGRGGMDTLKQVKRERPKLSVLVLSMYPEEQYAIRALKAGASGYLTKDSAPEELISAIKKVASGGKYVSSSLAEKLVFDLEKSTGEQPLKKLSDREYQVMLMIASGKTVKEIADELLLSVKTISTYRVRVLEKLAMKNNAEIMHYVIKEGLVK